MQQPLIDAADDRRSSTEHRRSATDMPNTIIMLWRRYQRQFNLLYCALGILVCYFYFGIAQESM